MTAITLLLYGCSPAIKQLDAEQEKARNETIQQQVKNKQFAKAIAGLRALLATPNNPRKTDYQLRIIELYMQNNEIEKALLERQKLISTPGNIAVDVRLQLIDAELALKQGRTYQALRQVPKLDAAQSENIQARILQLRAIGLLDIGNAVLSIKLRIQRTPLLADYADIEINQQEIWNTLSHLSEKTLGSLLLTSSNTGGNTSFHGWLELAQLSRKTKLRPNALLMVINEWSEKYAGHPATDVFITRLLEDAKSAYLKPQKVAVLLPFKGRLSKAAEAIRDGFLTAYYNDPDEKPDISFIDSGKDFYSFEQQFDNAIENGADVIIGPLDKSLVTELSRNGDLDVPTLTLNYGEQHSGITENLFQFGLLPEDEVRNSASLAILNGLHRAIILTPNNSWGKRLATAFATSFNLQGGQVIDVEYFEPKANDFSHSIKRLLNLDSSQSRRKILQRVLDKNVEFQPRRRQDADVIFIGASARQARLIKPQLKFHHAANIPVYATSQISTGVVDPQTDRDMDNIIYVDMPWTLEKDQDFYYQQIYSIWPKQLSVYSRLYALGIDAYHLIPHLKRLHKNTNERLPGRTGKLFIDETQRVHRELIPAKFLKGIATPLPTQIKNSALYEGHPQ